VERREDVRAVPEGDLDTPVHGELFEGPDRCIVPGAVPRGFRDRGSDGRRFGPPLRGRNEKDGHQGSDPRDRSFFHDRLRDLAPVFAPGVPWANRSAIPLTVACILRSFMMSTPRTFSSARKKE
jgi:hypothetical protein